MDGAFRFDRNINGMRPLGRLWHKWSDNNKMDLKVVS
jgi:hypothetical protein